MAGDTANAHEDEDAVAAAVRDYMRAHVVDLLERKGLSSSPDLIECPRCGDRTILLDQPATFAVDRRDRSQVCAACGAVQDVMKIMLPRFEIDVGGESG